MHYWNRVQDIATDVNVHPQSYTMTSSVQVPTENPKTLYQAEALSSKKVFGGEFIIGCGPTMTSGTEHVHSEMVAMGYGGPDWRDSRGNMNRLTIKTHFT